MRTTSTQMLLQLHVVLDLPRRVAHRMEGKLLIAIRTPGLGRQFSVGVTNLDSWLASVWVSHISRFFQKPVMTRTCTNLDIQPHRNAERRRSI